MSQSHQLEIKREKKKSLFLQKISSFLQLLAQDEQKFSQVFITHVDLSADSGICYIYFFAYPHHNEKSPEQIFKEILPLLKLHKSSLRKALAQSVKMRYVPKLVFLFDKKKEKVDKINKLLDKVQQELHKNSSTTDKDKN